MVTPEDLNKMQIDKALADSLKDMRLEIARLDNMIENDSAAREDFQEHLDKLAAAISNIENAGAKGVEALQEKINAATADLQEIDKELENIKTKKKELLKERSTSYYLMEGLLVAAYLLLFLLPAIYYFTGKNRTDYAERFIFNTTYGFNYTDEGPMPNDYYIGYFDDENAARSKIEMKKKELGYNK